MRKELLLWLFLCSQSPTFGQTVYFNYDNSGNRIRRESKLLKGNQGLKSDKLASTNLNKNSDISISTDDEQTKLFVSIKKNSSSVYPTISLYSLQGNLLATNTPNNGTAVFDIAGLATGVYLVSVESNGTKSIYKFTKK